MYKVTKINISSKKFLSYMSSFRNATTAWVQRCWQLYYSEFTIIPSHR